MTDRRLGLLNGLAMKPACRVATTDAITLSGEQTIDGVAVVSGNRVLVKDQASAVANGIYEADTGAWTRVQDADGNRDFINGTLVYVRLGTTNARTIWEVSSADDPIVVGTSSLTWAAAQVSADALVTAYMETVLAAGSASAARTLLGLALGTDVQAFNAALLSLAGLTGAADKIAYFTALDTLALTDFPAFARTLNAATSAAAARSVLGVGSIGGNMLTNGGMQIAQRGDGPFTAATVPINSDDTYVLDRWLLLSDGNDIVDVSRQADANFASGYAIELDIETANKKAGILYPLSADESKQLLVSGSVASLSFKAYGNNGTSIETLRAGILSWAGTADAITSDVVSAWNAAGADPTLAASWTFENTPAGHTLSASIQTFSDLNAAIDTASVKQVAVFIWIDDTTLTVGDKVRIGDVKLEAAAAATAYAPEVPAVAVAACRRHLQVTAKLANRAFGAGFNKSTTTADFWINFDPPMRIAPTVSVSAAADFKVKHTATSTDVTVLAAGTPSVNGVDLAATVASGLTAQGGATLIDDGNAAAQIVASAEL